MPEDQPGLARTTVEYRPARLEDAEAIARLHADSWRRAYRGMYSDEFLDGDLVGERLSVWRGRFEEADPQQFVLLATENDRLIGFVCAYGAFDEQWGSLIDNLHVSIDARRRGIATALMRAAGEWCLSVFPNVGVYLWVIEANHPARAFYHRIGAANAETIEAPHLSGNIGKSCRYVWPSPQALVDATR